MLPPNTFVCDNWVDQYPTPNGWRFFFVFAADAPATTTEHLLVKTTSPVNARSLGEHVFRAPVRVEEGNTVFHDFAPATEYVYFSTFRLLPRAWKRFLPDNDRIVSVNSFALKLEALHAVLHAA